MNKIEIKKINGDLIFSYEHENNTVKKTLEKAISSYADLRGADLRGANLIDANLIDANLRGVDLIGVDLRGANLRGANLRGVDLSGANLIGVDLSGANLSGVDLSGANLIGVDLIGVNLSGANLIGANLRDVNLRGANLRGADLSGVNLIGVDLSGVNLSGVNLSGVKDIPQSYINTCSRDMLYIFHTLKTELPQLREKLVKGEINGSQYEGSCACLIGSLANIKNTNPKDFCKSLLPYYNMGLHNPGEQWFYQIHSGDTPKNNFFAKHAVKLIDEVLLTD